MRVCAAQGVRLLLEAIPYGVNEVYLHTDEALMPRNRLTWASWNCIGSSDPSAQSQAVCVTYWLNNLQVPSRLAHAKLAQTHHGLLMLPFLAALSFCSAYVPWSSSSNLSPDVGSKGRTMLQRLPADAPPTFATLNPPRPPAANKTIRRLQLAHPSFSYAAHEAQQKLHTVQVEPAPLPLCQSHAAASAAADKA